ncbi:Hypothetical predicted protein [Mytilus galloprovincialis]|uniref:Reverse transcriptase domain-containing protein n=1 Tax=Mytilus galloprovincialis TaxID=29158 RepID=A0A8B6EB41_MYTGA|nr:Hypothetical predicted protein [Mytilus galloprovincialis]
MKIDKTSTQLVKIYTRPNWAKCDTNIYTSTLKQELECESRRKESSVEERIKLLEKSIHKAGKKSIPKYRQLKSLKTVGKGKLNTGKASDENGIVSEHYIHAIDVITDEITDIINQIFEELDVPQSLKNGILTPVLKKKKDKTIPGNYRGIVVTSIFSKIFETIIKDRLEPELFPSQNTLQRGFTEGASSLFTAFIVSETTMLYKFLKIVLELLTLDAEKAFDTVTHEIMLNKMFHDGIRGDMWVLLKNIYTNMTLQVKWGDQTTQHVNIQQGIRQGAKLSTLLYKRYNNTILNAITGSHLGAKIGTICVASPTCADDIALLGEPQDIYKQCSILLNSIQRETW